MIENQSDNIDDKENEVSHQENPSEDSAAQEDQSIENDEVTSQKEVEIGRNI